MGTSDHSINAWQAKNPGSFTMAVRAGCSKDAKRLHISKSGLPPRKKVTDTNAIFRLKITKFIPKGTFMMAK